MNALDQQRPTHRRAWWLQTALAVALVVVGAAGLWASFAGPATAEAHTPDREGMHGMMADHDAMHRMMNAMHGEGSAARMHDAEGAEEMMQECSTSMGSMEPGMGSMMSGMGSMMGSGARG
ncbi:MAG: hypothetical protein KY441_03715 [Actinobacteria bacterium]|nr:hypothetical protein [Actinomycetota bacterium]